MTIEYVLSMFVWMCTKDSESSLDYGWLVVLICFSYIRVSLMLCVHWSVKCIYAAEKGRKCSCSVCVKDYYRSVMNKEVYMKRNSCRQLNWDQILDRGTRLLQYTHIPGT